MPKSSASTETSPASETTTTTNNGKKGDSRRNSWILNGPDRLQRGSIFNPKRWTAVFDDENHEKGTTKPQHALKAGRMAQITQKELDRKKSLKSSCGAQIYGLLGKKVQRRGLTRYVKRFFVLKESFLLYFAASNNQKPVVKKWQMNIHPKGMICLGGCTITPCDGLENHKCGIVITSADFTHQITLVAETELERQKWMAALREASKITYKNAQLGEAMIRELEDQGLRLHREKQEYVDKLQSEADALRSEIEKCEELEKLKNELEEEKEKLAQNTRQLQSDLDAVKRELELTNLSKKTLEEEKENLNSKTDHLRSLLDNLELEKDKTELELCKMEDERRKFKQENTTLNRMSEQLRRKLDDIERQQSDILKQKTGVECKLRENVERAKQLEQEKEYYSHQAVELMATMNDLTTQKQKTEQELREEAQQRMLLERQLAAAERALEHLEKAMRLSGTHIVELKEQILPDVCQLKEFFEEVAYDSRLDADRANIMKTAGGNRIQRNPLDKRMCQRNPLFAVLYYSQWMPLADSAAYTF